MKRKLLLIIIIILSISLFLENSKAENEQYINGDTFVGCLNLEDEEKLSQLAISGDKETFQKALTAGFIMGICTAFKNGEVVYLEDTAIFKGLIKIRRKGEVAGYWTVPKAISETSPIPLQQSFQSQPKQRIHLKNGNTITGYIKERKENGIMLSTMDGKTTSFINNNEIEKIE